MRWYCPTPCSPTISCAYGAPAWRFETTSVAKRGHGRPRLQGQARRGQAQAEQTKSTQAGPSQIKPGHAGGQTGSLPGLLPAPSQARPRPSRPGHASRGEARRSQATRHPGTPRRVARPKFRHEALPENRLGILAPDRQIAPSVFCMPNQPRDGGAVLVLHPPCGGVLRQDVQVVDLA
jgi:hypothetical protein